MNAYIKKVDQFAAAPMFCVAVFFLIFLAGTLHLNSIESPGIALDVCNWCLFLLYPLFILETVIHVALGSPRWKFNLLYCLIPPIRICARDQMTGQAIWFPIISWQVVDSEFKEKVVKTFSAPMLLIALLVLPLFAVEHYWQKQIETNSVLADLTAIATGFIWFAFTLEFILMISIVEKRLDYCRRHWIDIAVICLPMIAFMRFLRVAGLLKTTRVFRLKSLVLKLYRALLILEIVNRLLQRNPEKRISRLEAILLEKEKEITDIKEEIAFLSERISPQPQTDSELAIQQDTQQFNNRAA
ncbi:hypothetical protein [uncultured Gimesia sp.]|uniref:hypothetical protein n=1 Tax=uncultured Gimesia sp. TaxID=1678688 RepID=UPI00260D097A|nr:hypothetical protein [uncultured Gimesia sp.]